MPSFDIAIIGTNLLSGLLAGLLARDHGRRVVRIGPRASAQRLQRHVDLALPLATRPESWRLLRGAEAATSALCDTIGCPSGISADEVEIVADRSDTGNALDHIAHLGLGYGHQIRRTGRGWAFRRVMRLHPEAIEGKLAAWLDSAGVTALDEGSADAALTILADDAALLDHLPEAQRPPLLVAEPMLATQIVAPRGLPVAIERYPDRGVTLLRRPGNAILALVRDGDDAEPRLASALSGPFPMKRLATTRYRRIVTADGAPLVGRLKPSKLFGIAGLGEAAAFMAPALARFIAGQSGLDEKRWFAAHDPSRPRAAIGEFVP